eukprot:143105-Pelagomonas_calceolata.AAC.1
MGSMQGGRQLESDGMLLIASCARALRGWDMSFWRWYLGEWAVWHNLASASYFDSSQSDATFQHPDRDSGKERSNNQLVDQATGILKQRFTGRVAVESRRRRVWASRSMCNEMVALGHKDQAKA